MMVTHIDMSSVADRDSSLDIPLYDGFILTINIFVICVGGWQGGIKVLHYTKGLYGIPNLPLPGQV